MGGNRVETCKHYSKNYGNYGFLETLKQETTQWLNPSKNAFLVQEIQRFLLIFWAVFHGRWLIDCCWSTGCVSSTTSVELGWWFHLTNGTWPCPLVDRDIIGTSYHPTDLISPFDLSSQLKSDSTSTPLHGQTSQQLCRLPGWLWFPAHGCNHFQTIGQSVASPYPNGHLIHRGNCGIGPMLYLTKKILGSFVGVNRFCVITILYHAVYHENWLWQWVK